MEGWDDLSSPAKATYEVLKNYRLDSKRLANQNDAWFLSVAQYRYLCERLGKKELIDGSGIIEAVRLRKSAQEIAYLRKSAEVCSASLSAAIAATAAGTYDNLIAAEAHRALIAAGSEYLGHALQVCSGPEAGLSFETWDAGVFSRMTVYIWRWAVPIADTTLPSRTVLVGNPDKRLQTMAEVSRDALFSASEALKPGATSGEVDFAARDLIRRAGTLPMHSAIGRVIRWVSAILPIGARDAFRALKRATRPSLNQIWFSI